MSEKHTAQSIETAADEAQSFDEYRAVKDALQPYIQRTGRSIILMSRLLVAALTIMTPPPISNTTLPGLISRDLQQPPRLSSWVGAAFDSLTSSYYINTMGSGKSVARCTTHTPRTSASVRLT
jgi:hypothetical protein